MSIIEIMAEKIDRNLVIDFYDFLIGRGNVARMDGEDVKKIISKGLIDCHLGLFFSEINIGFEIKNCYIMILFYDTNFSDVSFSFDGSQVLGEGFSVEFLSIRDFCSNLVEMFLFDKIFCGYDYDPAGLFCVEKKSIDL